MSINNKYLIIFSGFMFSLAGFSIEISTNTNIVNIVRLLIISLGVIILFTTLKFKIVERYYFSLFLFTIYIVMFLISSEINQLSFFNILREIYLYIIIVIFFVLFSNKKYKYFIIGVFYGMIPLLIYYFININFNILLLPQYRLYTLLNPNSIGMIATMFFFLVLYYINQKTFNKFFLILLLFISLIVILATKSRASIAMMILGTLYYLYVNKYYKVILLINIIFFFLFIYNYEVINNIFRINSPEGYSGNKNITNLAGRTMLWNEALLSIKNNFLFGVGGENAVVIENGKTHSYHNAYLQIFANNGLMGAIPILILLLSSLLSIFKKNKPIIFKVVFLSGLFGGMVESRLLNFGSPGNLLFLISLIYLSSNNIRRKRG